MRTEQRLSYSESSHGPLVQALQWERYLPVEKAKPFGLGASGVHFASISLQDLRPSISPSVFYGD